MNLTENSVISFTPDDGWEAVFIVPAADDPNIQLQGWTEPVIGWAVVVDLEEDGEGHTETGLEPVLLVEDRYPVTLHWHLASMDQPHPRVRIQRSAG